MLPTALRGGTGSVGRSPEGECRRSRYGSLREGMTQKSGCGRRTAYRRRNRPDTGTNRQVHSDVEPHARTGHGCRSSMAWPARPVDTVSALTGIADAGHGPPLCVRSLPGAGHRLPPLRPRPNLLRRRLLRGVTPGQPERGWPALPAQPSRPLCACRADAPLSQPPEESDASRFRGASRQCSTAADFDDAGQRIDIRYCRTGS